MPPIVISSAAEWDQEALVRIMTDVFLADQAQYIPEVLDPRFVESISRDLVRRAWPNMALARADLVPVAMMYVAGNKIDALNVIAGWKRRGIGRAMMEWTEDRLIAAGYASATLDTQEANAPARSFYDSLGYRVTAHWPMTQFTATPIPMVTMTKQL